MTIERLKMEDDRGTYIESQPKDPVPCPTTSWCVHQKVLRGTRLNIVQQQPRTTAGINEGLVYCAGNHVPQ
ncbi:predicted protein [Sclerotinia sclerotiorum 1980 UF-70]|uniref:Uncharacterized protein n=1 Tax=Sclerotinia sclerotiorum (strain ATCC 18683 / 1980 / Ss-1) TaxID=665079 RepID=A7EVU9_SCLS1|nr:predicted protein [Sclerotinia sclerotiorum 1980 UF-70]EDN93591.1 predicted protein [Sclerotinia sclerotiorum 1980 UF-70]